MVGAGPNGVGEGKSGPYGTVLALLPRWPFACAVVPTEGFGGPTKTNGIFRFEISTRVPTA